MTHPLMNKIRDRCSVLTNLLSGTAQTKERKERQRGNIDTANPDPEHELEKVAVVEVANAVVDPGAVVVHAQHTAAAHAAMVAARGLVLPALLAVPE